jgi:acetone carboxylase gamma subunit
MADNRKDVFVIQKDGEKNYWHRCGCGFVNRDGSINLKLDLFPGVQIQVRDPKEKENGEQH